MSTTSGSRDYGHFDELAEEFAERYRRGERPELQEYIERLPEMADEIREMFPALVEVEQVEADARDDALQQQQRAIPYLGQIGDYRILREVGRGGMGVVYEAEQISLGRRVALKVLPGQASGNRVVQERFRREARAAARLHHTNIVPVYEVGQDGDVRFYAMQFIDGQGLDAVITELIRLLDRARPESRIKAVAEGRSPWRRGQHSRQGIATPTLSDGVEVSLVLRSILTGRFDPVGRGPDPLKAPPSIRAGDPAEGRAAPSGTGTERPVAGSDLALTRTEAGSATSGDAIGPQQAQPPEPDSSMSPAPSSTSAILPGGTQLSSVESGRRAFFRSLAQIGRQVAGGLAYAHARGIVHRDIKPSNLLLDTEGVVWIVDFGLAKGDDEGLTQSGDILGTIRYMAPERFRGEGDARADVYALGLTLYELLTLRPGFDSSDRLKLIEQIKAEEPPRPRSVDGRIPRDLETIVLKAIEKDPRARYQSAEAMGDDLGRFLADEPIRARQVRAAERYWRWARRNPVIAVLGGVVTALLVAMTVGSTIAATYFQGLAGRESRANRQSQEAQRIAVASRKVAEAAQEQALLERDHSRRLSAGLALDKGIALSQEGHADRGLLWMLEALETAPDEAEGFRKAVRWNLGAWLGQVHKTLRIVETGSPCDDVAFSPDGRSFATGFIPRDPSLATPIGSWDTASGRKLSSWPGAFAPFAFRPDGKVLVALDDRRRVVAIDRVTRRVLWTTPPLPGEFGETIDFSPDASTVIATSSGGEHRWWLSRLDASTGRPLGETIPSIGFVAAAPDGRTVAARRVEGDKAYIDLIDLPSGRGTASWPASPNLLFLSAFRPDARSLFLSQPKGRILNQNSFFGRIWDPGTGRPTSPPMTSTTMAGYPPSADRLVTLTHSVWVVRDAESGRVRGCGLNAGAEAFLASHPDGRTMISASPDGVAHLWRISADAEPVFVEETDAPPSMSGIASDGRMGDGRLFRIDLLTEGRIAIASAVGAGARELIRLSDPTTGRPLGRPAAHYPGWKIRRLALSPDHRCFATGSNPDGRVAGEVRVWDASTGRLRFPPMPHTNYVGALAFQPDGKVLAAGDFNGLVRLWDGATGREIGRPLPQGEIVLSLAYSPDGATLAVGLSLEHTGKPGVRLWDTRTRQPIGELLPSTYAVSRIDFRPDGRILLAESSHRLSRTIRLWDVPRGRAIGEPMIDEGSGGFRPDGRAFLTVASDGTVKLRDAATGAVLVSLLTAPSRATCAAFRGDGGLVVAGFADGTVRLCDPATSQPVGPPRSMRHPVQDVAFAPDGRTIAAIDDFGESRTWPVPEPLPDESIDDLTLRIEARTGLRMETGPAISRLGTAAWRDRLERLGRLDPAAVQPDDDPAWHEPMIREAERNGHAFAALWHLDRLIAARPDDWYLHARRARAWSRSDRFDRADADYDRAERLGSREQVLDFQAHCVVDCTEAGRWAEALWYLDRLIAARPGDAMLREDRAAVYGRLGREADRRAELARVFELGADEGLVVPRAAELGRSGRWSEAAGLLARCGRAGPLSRELAQAWVIACLKAGDRAGYREACAAFLAGQGSDSPIVSNALAGASFFALGPDGLDDYRVPMGWLEKRSAAVPVTALAYRHLFSSALGGLLLRAGRVDEAIVRLNQGIAAGGGEIPTDRAYMALAHARRGDFAEARRLLERLRLEADSSASFWDLQELVLLRSEVESLLLDAEFPDDPFRSRGSR